MIVFHILDPAELEFPFRSTTLFKGLEGMPEILTEPHALRRAYQDELGAFLAELQEGLPDGGHRLRPAADRSEPGRPAVELPGVSRLGCDDRPDRLSGFATTCLDCRHDSCPLLTVSFPLIWALGFANAPLLYGLAAASVPILIHLLNRRKFREVPWAAMRFLLAAIRKNQRRIRIEQWLLLAIRTLIILLVVSAMAKPFLESFGVVIAGRRVHRVLVARRAR